MDLTKNKGKKNIFMCFRPVRLNAGSINSNRQDVSVDGGKQSTVIPKILKSLSDNNLVALSNRDVAGDGIGKKEKPCRRLSRVLKAVMFDASLSRRIRKRKTRLNSFGSHSNISSIQSNENSSIRDLSESDDMSKINSSRSSSRFSSTNNLTSLCLNCSCSIPPNSPEKSKPSATNSQQKNSSMKQGGYFRSNKGLCLLLSCLMVLIFWGKVCAICCTLTWLLFAPRRFNVVDSPAKVFDSPDVDSDDYKKRVIMEGMLDRNRSRVL